MLNRRGHPNSAYLYWGYVPSIRKPRHAQPACFGAQMEYQRAQVGMLVVFGRGANVGGHENAPHIGARFRDWLENLPNTTNVPIWAR